MTQTNPKLDYSRQRHYSPQQRGWLAALVGAFLWALAGAGFLAFASGCGGPACGLLAVIAVSIGLRRARRTRGMIVLGYLEQATRLNLPLPEYLWAAARSEGVQTARKLMTLRELLLAGYDVGPALHGAVPEIPERITGLVAAGERLGQLRSTLHRVASQERRRPEGLIDQAIFMRFYPLFVLTIMSWIVLGVLLYVVPKFREIFSDFRTPLPLMTERLLAAAHFMVDGPGWILMALVGMLLVFIMGQFLCEIFQPYVNRALPGREIRDRVAWYCPLAHGLARDRGLADIFEILGDALRAGRPLAEALTHVRRLHINAVLAARLAHAAALAERGTSLADSARAVGLPALATGLIATGEASGSLPETCDFLARYYRGRFSHTVILLQRAGEPVIVMLLGVLVGYVVIALFLPLVKLIDSVSGFSGVL